jgi:hypothetical protein
LRLLRYIELKSGHAGNGPAWIAFVTLSKSGRTVYFYGRGLLKRKGQDRGDRGGNYFDIESGESFWVSGVKKDGQDRHWAGSGKVLIEAAAVGDYLLTIGAHALDNARLQITHDISPTDIDRLARLANSSANSCAEDLDSE